MDDKEIEIYWMPFSMILYLMTYSYHLLRTSQSMEVQSVRNDWVCTHTQTCMENDIFHIAYFILLNPQNNPTHISNPFWGEKKKKRWSLEILRNSVLSAWIKIAKARMGIQQVDSTAHVFTSHFYGTYIISFCTKPENYNTGWFSDGQN